MKVVILAAGVGSRLRPITSEKPKCLVRVAGKPILQWQIEAFAALAPEKIIVVSGYRSEMVREFCQSLRNPVVDILVNAEHDVTNNMYSLFLAEADVRGQEFMLCNGDVVFDNEIVSQFARQTGSAIAADRGSFAQESMKIVVNDDGVIQDISKLVTVEQAWGNSIDLYRFSAEDSETLFTEIDQVLGAGDRNQWTEVAIQRLVNRSQVRMCPWDIQGRRWVEVDNYEDLANGDYWFSDVRKRVGRWELMFVDLDGTLYVGDSAVNGGAQWVNQARERKKRVFFLSNNSSKSKGQYVEKLKRLGITATENDVILSTDGMVAFLKQRGIRAVYTVGTEALQAAIRDLGIDPMSPTPEFVVLGYDTELTYERLATASRFLNAGVGLVATHPDMVCPSPYGPLPDAGAMARLLEITTGRKPEMVFGKPNVEMIQHVVDREGVSWDKVVVVGDRLYTDGELARRCGADFVLVLSGETRREDLERAQHWPTVVVPSVSVLDLRS